MSIRISITGAGSLKFKLSLLDGTATTRCWQLGILQKTNKYTDIGRVGKLFVFLTTNVASFLVTSVTASITSGANDRCWPATSVSTSNRTVLIMQQPLNVFRNWLRSADQWWFIASITARDDGVAELVLRQAFTAFATERVIRATVRFEREIKCWPHSYAILYYVYYYYIFKAIKPLCF